MSEADRVIRELEKQLHECKAEKEIISAKYKKMILMLQTNPVIVQELNKLIIRVINPAGGVSVLERLSTSLWGELFSYLHVDDLSRLDIAVGSQSTRQVFHEALRDCATIKKQQFIKYPLGRLEVQLLCYCRFLSWLRKRRVKVEFLYIMPDKQDLNYDEALSAYVIDFGISIKQIYFDTMWLASAHQLKLVGSCCSNLVKIGGDYGDLCGPASLSDEGIKNLQSCKYLQEVSISRIDVAFTNDAIIECLGSWTSLLHLDLSSTPSKIDDAVLQELGRHHSNMLTLNLGGENCEGVTDSGLRELAGLQQLQNLQLFNFYSISQSAMVDVISNLPDLQTLHLGGTPVGGMPLLRAICGSCPNLVSLTVEAGEEEEEEYVSYAYLLEFVEALPHLCYYYDCPFDHEPSSDEEAEKEEEMLAILRARNPSNKAGEDFGYCMV